MLDELPISMITYFCFGCDKCKDTKEELFVYIYNGGIYNRVYVFHNKTLYVFDIAVYKHSHSTNTYFSISGFDTIENVKNHFSGTISPRILSAAELLERMGAC